MNPIREDIYGRTANFMIVDFRMKSTDCKDAPFCIFWFQIIKPIFFIAATPDEFRITDIFQYTNPDLLLYANCVFEQQFHYISLTYCI